ncbi:molybdenum cofactor guanylyltransferase [Gammaproteobacteria bacterium]|mgnify:FL=1|jgi:molybdenum cofactor guanylyltransferase|nr:molybdenum cofactor guanylyltransferase [Gammaproteobacteria bacterium]MDC1284589.1 molybdenum cofactor guanylyltransferase [Gammaproteobacteria bacterium]
MYPHDNISGLILAGGRAQRMGGEDKGLVLLNDQAMIEYVLASLAPQVQSVAINANRSVEQYQAYGHPVIRDELSDFQGPLAGFASGLKQCSTDYMVTAPCDGPLLCNDYVQRLHQSAVAQGAQISVASDGKRLQPVYALLHQSLLPSLLDFLARGDRKIDLWYQQEGYAECDFSDRSDIFTNVNSREDLTNLGQQLKP